MSIDLLACKCGGPFSVEKEFDKTKTVFKGTVIKIEIVKLEETINPDSLKLLHELADERTESFLDGLMILKSTFLVREYYKGELQNDTITIYTAKQSASCGYKFELDKSYIVYANDYSNMYLSINIEYDRINGFKKLNTYWTNHCTRTTDLIDKEQNLLNKYLNRK